MITSEHAAVRSRQRGIPGDCIDLIVKFGTAENRPGGALEYKLRKKDREKLVKYYKHQIKLLDKAAQKAVLVSNDAEKIITVYNIE